MNWRKREPEVISFESQEAATGRLQRPGALSEAELRGMLRWSRLMPSGVTDVFKSEVTLQTLLAIKEFDRSSRRLSTVLIWLTVALIFFSLVALWPIVEHPFCR
jgi:hypothetical protein